MLLHGFGNEVRIGNRWVDDNLRDVEDSFVKVEVDGKRKVDVSE
jgi:hypothetical protein